MKIHGITLIKNEADIVELFLEHALKWCDYIYVFDNGSEDDTWERVQAFSRKDSRVIPYKSEACPFRNELRAEVYHAYKHKASQGDWWCRLDADEFYIDEPKRFLSEVPRCHHVVWSAHFQYYLTHDDVKRWEGVDEEHFVHSDFSMLPKYYACNAAETRFFRHRDALVWEENWPRHIGVVHPRRIRLKHYQYRSPTQVQRRLDTRRAAKASGFNDFSHSLESDWKEKLVGADELTRDDAEHYEFEEAALPPHQDRKSIYWIKRFMHGLGIWA